MATPALGPSFGVAPAGTCTWMSVFSRVSPVNTFASVSAACADSFITSPSWPVRISLPVPGVREASMNRMSPPTEVQARPVATPGTEVRSASSLSKRRAPRMACRSFGST